MEIILILALLVAAFIGQRRWAAVRALKAEVVALRLRVTALETGAAPVAEPDVPAEAEPEPVIAAAAPLATAEQIERWQSRPVTSPRVPRPRATPRARPDWERWIGTHLLALGGAAFLLLGTSFFVALAINNGWLTPSRQVVLAVVAGTILAVLALRLRDGSDRARNLLGQSLAGAGAGATMLGLVAGARVYATPVLPAWLALTGAGVAGGYLVFCGWRWRAQATAALGITAALVAPPLVGAQASLTTAAFVGVALLVAGAVTVRRAWPWLAHAGLWLTAPQVWVWLKLHRAAFQHDTASTMLASGVIAVVAGWWVLVAMPAIIAERHGRWRVPQASVIVGATSLATGIGFAVLGFSFDPSGWPVRVLALALVGAHVAASAWLWRTARPAALLLAALAGAIAAVTATAVVGTAGQGVFWSIEAIALMILARRERDVQSAIAGLGAFALAVLAVVKTAPVTSLAYGTTAPMGAALAGLALAVALLMGAGFNESAGRRKIWLGAAALAFAWTTQAVVVSLVAAHPGTGVTEQRAQLAATGALALLGVAGLLLMTLQAPTGQRHRLALGAASALAVKAAVVDIDLGSGTRTAAIAIPLITLALALIALVGGRGQAGDHVPAATPAVILAAIGTLANLRPDAWAVGSAHLRSSLGLWAALAIALVALAIYPGSGRRVSVRRIAGWRSSEAAVAAWLLAAAGAALAAVIATTLVHPHAGTSTIDLTAQEVVTAILLLWWVLSSPLQTAAAVPVLVGALVALKALTVDVVVFGDHPGGLAIDGVALACAALWPLRTRVSLIPASGPAGLAAIAALAIGGVALAGVEAAGSGTTEAIRGVTGLGLAAILALATALRHDGPPQWRHGLVISAVVGAVWAGSIALVAALTPTLGTIDRGAQLALSIGWAAAAIVLVAVGLVRRGDLASVARRSGIPLLGAAIVKVLAYDTAQVSIAQRAGLFLAIGALLLVGAYLYTRLVREAVGADQTVTPDATPR